MAFGDQGEPLVEPPLRDPQVLQVPGRSLEEQADLGRSANLSCILQGLQRRSGIPAWQAGEERLGQRQVQPCTQTGRQIHGLLQRLAGSGDIPVALSELAELDE
jgi:hypothetical protein